MRRRALILASAASAAAILGGWQLGNLSTATAPLAQGGAGTMGSGTGSSTAAASGTGISGTGATGSGAGGSAAANAQAAAKSAADGTYAGATVSTRFGDVQVQVTIAGGAITDVTPLHLTDADGRSVSISNRAAPMLRDEVLQAQSASVSMIGGATYTSMGYLRSLQSALDQAGF